MPGPAPQVTDRDIAALRAIAQFGAAPPAALAHLFVSPAAGYVRLGLLTRRGLLRRTAAFGRRAYAVTADGAHAAGIDLPRAGSGPAARSARLGAVAAALARLGYAPAEGVPRRTAKSVAWFARGKRLLAVYPSSARLTGRGVRRVMQRLRIHRHTAHLVVLAGSRRTRPHELRDPVYAPTVAIPVPISPEAAALLGRRA